jgi:hypothetical protein
VREMRNAYKIFVRKTEGINHLKDLDVEGEIFFPKQILEKSAGRMQTGFIWLVTGTSGGLFEL